MLLSGSSQMGPSGPFERILLVLPLLVVLPKLAVVAAAMPAGTSIADG